jgi:hypothetical protein
MNVLGSVFASVVEALKMPMSIYGFTLSWFGIMVFSMVGGLIGFFVRGLFPSD